MTRRAHVMSMATAATGGRRLAPATLRKLTRRIAWFTTALFVFSYIDRSNVSLVAVDMNRDLGLSAAAYGLGASIFFLGYAVFEIPSNMMLYRFGARIWIGRIAITWGLLAGAMALIGGTTSFYALRFLIGVAEAGFQPGIVFYLSRWFPGRERAHAISVFNTAGPLSIVLGAPVTGLLLSATDGGFGVAGWRWVFLLEALPSVLLGLWTLFYLPERPVDANWLEAEEQQTLAAILSSEHDEAARHQNGGWFGWVSDLRVMAYAGVFFCLACANYGVIFWLPQIVNGMGTLSRTQVGLITAIPFLVAVLCMRWVARYSDRTGNRRGVIAGCALGAGLGLVGSAYVGSPVLSLACLCVVATCIWSSYSPFWAALSAMMAGGTAATGLAFVNSIGQVGGLLAPFLVGVIRDSTGKYQLGLVGMAVMCFIAFAIAASVRPRPRDAPQRA